jgi:hypothetical protein
MQRQGMGDPPCLGSSVPIDLAQLERTAGTVQVEHCLAAAANHMNMGRPMVVRVHDNALSLESQDGRHVAQYQ